METILLHGCRIITGGGLAAQKGWLPQSGNTVFITEKNVHEHYGRFMEDYPLIVIRGGETSKSWETVEYIVSRLIELEADRTTLLVGFGGGCVCDVTGFVASVYMRGCRFGFVPTTLLAQADASIGGKNGINFQGYKNLLGLIRAPEFVICDPTLLESLPEREYRSGLAEVVKAAVIGDKELFEEIECRKEQMLAKEAAALESILRKAVKVKVDIVSRDEQEQDVRRLLNLGHTFAHAFEKEKKVRHGEAVAAGLCLICRIAVQEGKMLPEEAERVCRLLEDLGLPTQPLLPMEALLPALKADKKRQGEYLFWVMPYAIGMCKVERISYSSLEKILK